MEEKKMKIKSGRRALALVLALVMVLGLMPAAQAAPAQSEAAGFKTIAQYLEEKKAATYEEYKIYPANLFLTTAETREMAIRSIQDDMVERVAYFREIGKNLEAKRLEERVSYDIEMIRELGHCSGIENYSRYFDGRAPGTRPYCLLDFFPKDFLMVIDESHVTVPQIHAMYGGDKARKNNLVQFGFRLPAARDNRTLTFDEFEEVMEDEIHANTASRSFDRRRKPDLILSAWALRGFVPFVYAHNCFWFMPVIFSNAAKENIPAVNNPYSFLILVNEITSMIKYGINAGNSSRCITLIFKPIALTNWANR